MLLPGGYDDWVGCIKDYIYAIDEDVWRFLKHPHMGGIASCFGKDKEEDT